MMYFFRVFEIVNAGFKLILLSTLEKDSEMILTKGTVKLLIILSHMIFGDLPIVRMELNSHLN